MKTTNEVFKEVLEELGFAGYKPSQMTNSDYWLCTTTAMKKYAELVKNCNIPIVVSSLTAKDKLYLNTLLVNKLLEKEDDGTYKAVNDTAIMDRVNDLMEKVNNS